MTHALALLLLTRLLHPVEPTPQSVSTAGLSLVCVFLSQADARADGATGKVHASACVNELSGEILGAVLTQKGLVRCDLGGFFDVLTGCATITGCGVTATRCG